MSSPSFWISLVLLLYVVNSAPRPIGKVVNIDSSNFNKELNKNDYLFIKFDSPVCDVCKEMDSDFAEIAYRVQLFTTKVTIARCDAEESPDLAEKLNAYGFPTFLLVNKKKHTIYHGPKTIRETVDWIKKQVGFLVEPITNEDEIANAEKEYDVVCLHFGSAKEGIFDSFFSIVRQHVADSTIKFMHTTSKDLYKKYQVKGEGEVVIFKRFEEKPIIFREKYDVGSFSNFFNQHASADVMSLSPKAAELIFKEDKKSLLLIRGITTADMKVQLQFVDAKDELKNKFTLAIADVTETMGSRLIEFLKIQPRDIPAVILIQTIKDQMTKYIMEGEITKDNILDFVKKFDEGTLKPKDSGEEQIGKEEEKEEGDSDNNNTAALIREVVSSQFDKVVRNQAYDVFLEVYAPWCHGCEKFSQITNTLAERYSGTKDLIFARIDGSNDDIEGLIITAYPTVLLYNKNDDIPVLYEGDYSLNDVRKFLNTHTTAKLHDKYQDDPKEEGQEEGSQPNNQHADFYYDPKVGPRQWPYMEL